MTADGAEAISQSHAGLHEADRQAMSFQPLATLLLGLNPGLAFNPSHLGARLHSSHHSLGRANPVMYKTSKEPTRRQLQVGEYIRNRLAEVIFNPGDKLLKRIPPGLNKMVEVTEVDISPDLLDCKVWVDVIGDKKEKVMAVRWLQSNVKPFRWRLAQKMRHFKRIPRLLFYHDDSIDQDEVMAAKLEQMRKEDEAIVRSWGSSWTYASDGEIDDVDEDFGSDEEDFELFDAEDADRKGYWRDRPFTPDDKERRNDPRCAGDALTFKEMCGRLEHQGKTPEQLKAHWDTLVRQDREFEEVSDDIEAGIDFTATDDEAWLNDEEEDDLEDELPSNYYVDPRWKEEDGEVVEMSEEDQEIGVEYESIDDFEAQKKRQQSQHRIKGLSSLRKKFKPVVRDVVEPIKEKMRETVEEHADAKPP